MRDESKMKIWVSLEDHQRAIEAAYKDAAGIVQKRREDYDDVHGNTDRETGAREYPTGGDEYVHEMQEIEDSILARLKQIKKEGVGG